MVATELIEHWRHVISAAGGKGDVDAIGAQLHAAYASSHRHYHDLRHLCDVLGRVDQLHDEADDAVVVKLAAWFHDAVYEGKPDDEAHSANLARRALTQLALPASTVDEVVRLVLLTASHEVEFGDRNGAVLCDADLAILAAEPTRYAQYAAGVRREWSHLDDATFCAGRREVLQRLLNARRLFTTNLGAASWEQQARINIDNELQSMTYR